jgi:hypothetical protein
MKNVVLKFVFASCLVLLSACGGGDSDFDGTFIGEERSLNSQVAANVTLTMSQSGQNITGTYTTSGTGFGPSSGTLSGVANANTVQLTVSITPSQGGQACQLSGTATQTSGVITAQLSGNCQQSSFVTATLRRHQ